MRPATRCCSSPPRRATGRSPARAGLGPDRQGRRRRSRPRSGARAVAGDAGSRCGWPPAATSPRSADARGLSRHDATNPLVSITGAGSPAPPQPTGRPVPSSTNGAWRVSYWSDKSGGRQDGPARGGDRARNRFGSGGGRVSTLLTDLPSSADGRESATPGGVNALPSNRHERRCGPCCCVLPRTPHRRTSRPRPCCTGRAATSSALRRDDSTDPDDGIDSWAWDFGDGDTSTDPTVEHVYDDPGTYTVKLTVTDDTGVTDDAEQTFTLGSPPPPPAISFVGRQPAT